MCIVKASKYFHKQLANYSLVMYCEIYASLKIFIVSQKVDDFYFYFLWKHCGQLMSRLSTKTWHH